MLPLGSIFRKHGLSFHCYADDTQIYLPLKQSSNGPETLMSSLSDVKAWLSLHFLNFNGSEIIVFGPSDSRSTPKVNLGDLTSSVKPWVKNLGVIFDDGLKLINKQINMVVKYCFFQLRLLAKVKPILSSKNVDAFNTSRLDYCNSLYFGIGQTALSRLQRVQNSAARLLTSTKKWDHITPVFTFSALVASALSSEF